MIFRDSHSSTHRPTECEDTLSRWLNERGVPPFDVFDGANLATESLCLMQPRWDEFCQLNL